MYFRLLRNWQHSIPISRYTPHSNGAVKILSPCNGANKGIGDYLTLASYAVGEVGLPYYLHKKDPTIQLDPFCELLDEFIQLAKV